MEREAHLSGKHVGDSSAPSAVRGFTITRGRTVPRVELPFEATLLVSIPSGHRAEPTGPAAQVLEVCDRKSVAEVAAALHLPLGVARVLLADLVAEGHVTVQRTLTRNSSIDERRDLLQRTLQGLLVS
ncbi:DUF742 domain-containing protein [Nocardioides gilvus]|uniref:DUF742 domain-containing protein n=1 Tax=Nocardioides gilvus TaxID=1735589 RepID=UPI000D744AB9|nr:DUF742 domain-containing protein [Nocardioides gilvus]